MRTVVLDDVQLCKPSRAHLSILPAGSNQEYEGTLPFSLKALQMLEILFANFAS